MKWFKTACVIFLGFFITLPLSANQSQLGKILPGGMDNLGFKSRFTSEMGGSYMTEYFQDRFYVRLSITPKSEETKKSILRCAKTISENIARHYKK
jgi:hypothetical protein